MAYVDSVNEINTTYILKNLKSYQKCLELLRTLDSKNMKTILQGKKII